MYGRFSCAFKNCADHLINAICFSFFFVGQVTEPIADEPEHEEVPDPHAIISTDNYSMPYFSPLIFVPPIPFVPGKNHNQHHANKIRSIELFSMILQQMLDWPIRDVEDSAVI